MPTLAGSQLSALQTRPGTRPKHPSASSSAAPPASLPSSILARLEKPPVPSLIREFLPCDLTLIANAKRATAALRARFPRVHFLFLSAGAVSLKGLEISEEGVDRRMAALYHSRWAFIEGLLPAHGAGRTRAWRRCTRQAEAGLWASMTSGGGLKSVRKLVLQLASYQDLMAEAFATHDSNAGISPTHAFPGTVDTPLLRASPSAILRAVHYVRFLIFPTLMFRAMSIEECGAPPAPPAPAAQGRTSGWAAWETQRGTRRARWSNTAALQQLLSLVLPSYSIPTPMPLFTSASGVQINGGNFIDIAGDVNLHNLQPAIAQNSDPLSATQSRRLLGVDRNAQNGGARLVPYDASRRPQILSSASGQNPQEESWSNSAAPIQLLSNLPPFTSAQPEYSPSFFKPGPQRPPVIHSSSDNGSIGTPGFEYPLSNALISATPGEYSHTSPMNRHDIDPSIIHPSIHLQPLAGPPGEPAHSFTGDFRNDEPESSITAINRTQWGGLQQEPKTSINIGGNLNHMNIQRHGEAGLHILYRAAAGDATHDSEDRFPQPRCHPETRTKMLDVLGKWTCGIEPPEGSSSDHNSSPILWLHGPAGAGKSAIAQTLCQKLEKEGRLGASFFFKREHPSRGHAKRLFATIAYQLALVLPDLKHHISQSVENNPSLVDKSLSTQFRKLIVESCRQSTSTHMLVVVIDGLDECEGQKVQQEILCLIGRAVTEQQLPLRFLIASRPESHIREIFTGALNNIHCPLNVEQSFQDVRRYLFDEFARIHRDHRATMARVPYPWPTPEIIKNLVNKSSGYFIYASTVIKFIDDTKFRPTERLAIINGMTDPLSESPFASLDWLYTQILSQIHVRPQLLKILTVITTGIFLSPAHIEQLLELEQGDVRLALHGLHSVISHLEEDNSDYLLGLNFHHASFRDFLQDPRRAGIFYVGGSSHRTDLSHCILKAFSYMYQDPSQNRRGHVSG
ncbi:hypothetical protein B0H13DRAFT_2468821 [Mycena leptocephala]|nr:hypothetical protein B0H13DRAFT_2468821 [Mycena leptocephala]